MWVTSALSSLCIWYVIKRQPHTAGIQNYSLLFLGFFFINRLSTYILCSIVSVADSTSSKILQLTVCMGRSEKQKCFALGSVTQVLVGELNHFVNLILFLPWLNVLLLFAVEWFTIISHWLSFHVTIANVGQASLYANKQLCNTFS